MDFEKISKKEAVLDDGCDFICLKLFPRHLMERAGLMKYAGVTGKTRIVIEYNNDTGEGWMRVVSEDPISEPIQKCQLEHPEHPQDCPTGCIRCIGDKHC